MTSTRWVLFQNMNAFIWWTIKTELSFDTTFQLTLVWFCIYLIKEKEINRMMTRVLKISHYLFKAIFFFSINCATDSRENNVNSSGCFSNFSFVFRYYLLSHDANSSFNCIGALPTRILQTSFVRSWLLKLFFILKRPQLDWLSSWFILLELQQPEL